MTNSQRLAIVRAHLRRWLAQQQGVDDSVDAENPILSESILIRNEFYCGRRFHTSTHDAVWFMEEDELKIYHGSGELACVFSGKDINRDERTENATPRVIVDREASSPDVIKLPTPAEQRGDSDGEIRRAA